MTPVCLFWVTKRECVSKINWIWQSRSLTWFDVEKNSCEFPLVHIDIFASQNPGSRPLLLTHSFHLWTQNEKPAKRRFLRALRASHVRAVKKTSVFSAFWIFGNNSKLQNCFRSERIFLATWIHFDIFFHSKNVGSLHFEKFSDQQLTSLLHPSSRALLRKWAFSFFWNGSGFGKYTGFGQRIFSNRKAQFQSTHMLNISWKLRFTEVQSRLPSNMSAVENHETFSSCQRKFSELLNALCWTHMTLNLFAFLGSNSPPQWSYSSAVLNADVLSSTPNCVFWIVVTKKQLLQSLVPFEITFPRFRYRTCKLFRKVGFSIDSHT